MTYSKSFGDFCQFLVANPKSYKSFLFQTSYCSLDQIQYMLMLKKEVRNFLLNPLHSIMDGIVEYLQ